MNPPSHHSSAACFQTLLRAHTQLKSAQSTSSPALLGSSSEHSTHQACTAAPLVDYKDRGISLADPAVWSSEAGIWAGCLGRKASDVVPLGPSRPPWGKAHPSQEHHRHHPEAPCIHPLKPSSPSWDVARGMWEKLTQGMNVVVPLTLAVVNAITHQSSDLFVPPYS